MKPSYDVFGKILFSVYLEKIVIIPSDKINLLTRRL